MCCVSLLSVQKHPATLLKKCPVRHDGLAGRLYGMRLHLIIVIRWSNYFKKQFIFLAQNAAEKHTLARQDDLPRKGAWLRIVQRTERVC